MQHNPDDNRTAYRSFTEGGSPAPLGTAPELAFRPALFRSFFLGGFECSTHRRRDGQRLDKRTRVGRQLGGRMPAGRLRNGQRGRRRLGKRRLGGWPRDR